MTGMPLTPSQVSMLGARAAGEPPSSLVLGIELEGRLDPARLDAAYRELQRRHPFLRLRYGEDGARADDATVPLERLDRPGSVGNYRDAMVQLASALGRPRDLWREGPIAAQLVRLGPEVHALLVAVDHLAADAWALSLIGREWGRLYAGATLAEPPDVAAVITRYWASKRLRSYEDAGRALVEELAGAAPPRWPAVPDGVRGWAYQQASVPRRFWRAIKRHAAARRTTPFALGVAALGVALHRAGLAPDLLVSAHVANRTVSQSERVVASTYTTMPMRVRPADPASAAAWATAGHDATGRALRRQHLPLAVAEAVTSANHGLPAGAVMQVMLGCDQHPFLGFEAPGLAIREVDMPDATPVGDSPHAPRFTAASAPFPARLTVTVRETWTELQLFVHYDRLLGDRNATLLMGSFIEGLVWLVEPADVEKEKAA